jgi:hypothetical protein
MSSTDAWIASLGDEPTAPSPLSQSMAGLSLTTAGSGSLGEYGGVAKRANLLFCVDVAASERLCFGFVGSESRRFCLKAVKGDSGTCGVTKHAVKFDPKADHFYLRSNDATAFCEPCFPVSIVPTELRDIFKTTPKTIEEWKIIFAEYLRENSGQFTQVDEATRYLFPDPEKFALKTPRKVPLFEGEFPAVVVPSELVDIKDQNCYLADEQYWWNEDDSTSLLPTPLFEFLKKLRSFLIKYDQWLVEPFDVMSLRFDTVEGDLHKLKHHCETLELAIGSPLSLQGSSFPDLWSAIEFASSLTTGSESVGNLAQSVEELKLSFKTLNDFPAKFSDFDKKLMELGNLCATYDARFQRIHPILLSVRDLQSKFMALEASLASRQASSMLPSAVSNDPWLHQFHSPSAGGSAPIGSALNPAVVSPTSSPPTLVNDAEARLRSIEHQLKSLEKRVVGDGIRVGRFLFQSREDLRIWLATHVPTNRFGLFLDGVSVFDFLAHTHMDSQENMTHLYNSQKNGFDTIYESKVISSMQNLFPNLFGKSGADGMDTSKTLPGLQSSDKWNADGVTGLQIQVERELPNVDLQFRNAIISTFEDSPDARELALELLYRSKKFALDLCQFMQRDVDFWRHKGYTKQTAWELTCLSVRRVFEDIHVVRVVGRDSRDLKNPSSTATQILWATLRSHKVMEEYTRRNFVEHPSISAVIARHLASHHTKPDDTLENKFKKLEEKVNKLSSRFDSIESRMDRLEQKNGITPPRRGRGGGKNKDKDEAVTAP